LIVLIVFRKVRTNNNEGEYMTQTLFDKYGGYETVTKLVSNFYNRVLKDDSIASYFSKTDMTKMVEHQSNFLSTALGGPDNYKGRDLKSSHQHLGLTDSDFGSVARHLTETLREAGVEESDVEGIISLVAGLKDQIVSKKAA
jgi:hemoglobin